MELEGGCYRVVGAGLWLLQDEVYAFLRVAGWRVWSWSWSAAEATLLDKVYAPLRAAGVGAGILLLLPYWMKCTPSFAPPDSVRGAGAGRPLPLP